MQYPNLPANAKSISFASSGVYSPYFDLVWSFDYAISGNAFTEAGFAVFLQDSKIPILTGGNGGIDLGYSGLSSLGLPYTINPGISGGIIGVGFDTTGLFAASASIGSTKIRSGIDSSKVYRNSITIRSDSPEYDYEDYSFTAPITSLIDTTFNIVESGINYKTVRARLGDVGRVFYIDYRNNPSEDFKNILTKKVTLNSNINSLYRVGVSFATPISSSSSNATGNIYFKNFHIEGSSNNLLSAGCDLNCNALSGAFDGTGVCIPIDITCLHVACPESSPECLIEPCVSTPPAVINFNVVNIDEFDTADIFNYLTEGVCVSVDKNIANTCINAATGVDLFNFGYKLNITGGFSATLTRYEPFGYKNIANTITAKLNAIGDNWTIRDIVNNRTYTNSSVTPIGTYTRTGSTNLTVTYVQ